MWYHMVPLGGNGLISSVNISLFVFYFFLVYLLQIKIYQKQNLKGKKKKLYRLNAFEKEIYFKRNKKRRLQV